MKTINELITESKTGSLKKLYMLTIEVMYQMNVEYKVYDDFFSKLSDEEIEDYDDLVDKVAFYDEQNARVQWSSLKKWFPLINKTCDYVANASDDLFSKSDKRIWKEMKQYVS